MKYPARITLLAEGGRETALFHSPFLCNIKFDDDSIYYYGIRLIFDTDSLWNLGETRDCFIELTGFEKLSDINWTKKIYLYEGKTIGEGEIGLPS